MLNLLALLLPALLAMPEIESRVTPPPRRPRPPATETKALTAPHLDAVKRGESVELLVKLRGAPDDALSRTGARRDIEVFGPAKRALRELSGAKRLEITDDYSHLPLVAVRVSSEEGLAALLSINEVESLRPPYEFQATLTESLPLISQPAAAAAGRVGTGTTVAVLDTGVDYSRPEFGSCTAPGTPASCRVVYAQDFAPEDGLRDDPATLHGTNVAAIVAAVAPGAKIAALDVYAGSSVSETAAIAAINWSIANRAVHNIVAVNTSFGAAGTHELPCDDAVGLSVVNSALAAGILIVAPSGNGASHSGLGRPACFEGVASVGAVYDADLGSQSYDVCTDPATSANRVAAFRTGPRISAFLRPGREFPRAA